jgi:hypothetical protein
MAIANTLLLLLLRAHLLGLRPQVHQENIYQNSFYHSRFDPNHYPL